MVKKRCEVSKLGAFSGFTKKVENIRRFLMDVEMDREYNFNELREIFKYIFGEIKINAFVNILRCFVRIGSLRMVECDGDHPVIGSIYVVNKEEESGVLGSKSVSGILSAMQYLLGEIAMHVESGGLEDVFEIKRGVDSFCKEFQEIVKMYNFSSH